MRSKGSCMNVWDNCISSLSTWILMSLQLHCWRAGAIQLVTENIRILMVSEVVCLVRNASDNVFKRKAWFTLKWICFSDNTAFISFRICEKTTIHLMVKICELCPSLVTVPWFRCALPWRLHAKKGEFAVSSGVSEATPATSVCGTTLLRSVLGIPVS